MTPKQVQEAADLIKLSNVLWGYNTDLTAGHTAKITIKADTFSISREEALYIVKRRIDDVHARLLELGVEMPNGPDTV